MASLASYRAFSKSSGCPVGPARHPHCTLPFHFHVGPVVSSFPYLKQNAISLPLAPRVWISPRLISAGRWGRLVVRRLRIPLLRTWAIKPMRQLLPSSFLSLPRVVVEQAAPPWPNPSCQQPPALLAAHCALVVHPRHALRAPLLPHLMPPVPRAVSRRAGMGEIGAPPPWFLLVAVDGTSEGVSGGSPGSGGSDAPPQFDDAMLGWSELTADASPLLWCRYGA